MMARRSVLVCWGLVLVLVGGLLMSGCSSKQLELASQDSGGQNVLKPGQTFTLTLESNPTTGYSWEFVGLDDQDVVELVKTEYKADSDLIGAGGVDIMQLKAVQAGDVELKLIYHRSWEEGVEPIATFTYTVSVRD